MMNKREFDELETIRNDIKTHKQQIDKINAEIIELKQGSHDILDPLKKSLETKQFEMLNDKDLRTEQGLSNQTAWQKKIKELTYDEQAKIDSIAEDYQIKIKALTDLINSYKDDILDLQMEHANKLAYYQQPEKVCIDLNVLSSSK